MTELTSPSPSRPGGGGSSPEDESRTESKPISTSGPCSPSAEGIASRKTSEIGPSSPAGCPASAAMVAAAVRASLMLVLSLPVDQGSIRGCSGSGAAGWLSTITASSSPASE